MKNLIIAAILLSGSAIADDLTIPNTFTAGTPARAADVNANFTAVEAAVNANAAGLVSNTAAINDNASSLAANATAIRINSTNIDTNTVANQELNARVIALENQVAILLDHLSPPTRVIKGSLGNFGFIVNSETWRLSTGLIRVNSVTEEIDPFNPRADLSVTITPASGFTVTECALQNQTQVLIGIPADPNLPIDFGISGVTFANVSGGSALDGELRSGVYFSTLQTIDTTFLTFVDSYTPTEGAFFDTGVPSFIRLENSCGQIQNVGFVANSNVLRIDFYTAPVVPLPLTPPFMSVVN